MSLEFERTKRFWVLSLTRSNYGTGVRTPSDHKTVTREKVQTAKNQASSGKKISPPNFFIAFRLNDSTELVEMMTSFQRNLITSAPQLAKCLTPPKKAHITCFVMTLSSKIDIHNAAKCLQQCKEELDNIVWNPPQLSLKTVSTFGQSVLYVGSNDVDEVKLLTRITNCIQSQFMDPQNKLRWECKRPVSPIF